jgi:hypothetical protein
MSLYEVRVILTESEYVLLEHAAKLHECHRHMYMKAPQCTAALMKLAAFGLIKCVANYPATYHITPAGEAILELIQK